MTNTDELRVQLGCSVSAWKLYVDMYFIPQKEKENKIIARYINGWMDKKIGMTLKIKYGEKVRQVMFQNAVACCQ